jgi:hypothetical protein
VRSTIDALLDHVEWKPIEYAGDVNLVSPEGKIIPHAVMEGMLHVGNIAMKVYQLSDGQRIIAAEDVEKFFGVQ